MGGRIGKLIDDGQMEERISGYIDESIDRLSVINDRKMSNQWTGKSTNR